MQESKAGSSEGADLRQVRSSGRPCVRHFSFFMRRELQDVRGRGGRCRRSARKRDAWSDTHPDALDLLVVFAETSLDIPFGDYIPAIGERVSLYMPLPGGFHAHNRW